MGEPTHRCDTEGVVVSHEGDGRGLRRILVVFPGSAARSDPALAAQQRRELRKMDGSEMRYKNLNLAINVNLATRLGSEVGRTWKLVSDTPVMGEGSAAVATMTYSSE